MLIDKPIPGIEVFVPGRPAPQGSKRYFGPGRVVEMSKYVAGWREDIRTTLSAEWGALPPLTGAIYLRLQFALPRPASTPKRRTPPAIKRPDWDKLSRAVCDAITSAGVYRDDSQVVEAWVSKRIAELDEQTGCLIRLWEIADEQGRETWVDTNPFSNAGSGSPGGPDGPGPRDGRGRRGGAARDPRVDQALRSPRTRSTVPVQGGTPETGLSSLPGPTRARNAAGGPQ